MLSPHHFELFGQRLSSQNSLGVCIVRANWKVKNALDRHNLRIGQFLGKALSLGFEHRSVLGVDDQARRLRSWQDGAPIDFGDGS